MQERFNRYCLTKQITSKSSGSVYLAYPSNHTSQKVVLKVFEAAHFSSEQQSQRFLQQAKGIRQLKHSSIVPILDLGVEQGQPYIVREYLASDSLRRRLDDLSPQGLDLQDALKIIFQIGQALRYAHQHQILHGNLKPENIFFNSNDKVLLSDFGITSCTDVTTPDQHGDQQTMSYLAPEQLVGSVSEKSDQYTLACLTYELITGRVPFSAPSSSPVASQISNEDEPTSAIEGKERETSDQAEQVQTEIFCENRLCPDYRKVGRNNVRKFGRTRKGVQRWQCKTCRATWSFSPIEIRPHTELIPPSDLVPNLPESIEEAVLKAMAKDPPERYADITIFLNALQIALLLPTFPFTSISPVTPLPTHIPKLFEKTQSEAPVTIHARKDWKHVQNDYSASKALEIPDSDTYHTNNTIATSHSDAYLPSKTVVKPKTDAYLPSHDLAEAPLKGRHPQSKPLAPTLWLAFALSGIALLLGTMVLYTLVPSHTPGSAKPIKSNPTVQPPVQVINTPTAQSSVQPTQVSTASTLSPIPIPTPTSTSTSTPIPRISYEAESSQNTLTGSAQIYGCAGCSGGKRVAFLGKQPNGANGTLQFNNVNKSIVGSYTMTIYYNEGDTGGRTGYVSVNGGPAITFTGAYTGDWNNVGTVNMTISLSAGSNTIKFFNPTGPGPDIDRIVV